MPPLTILLCFHAAVSCVRRSGLLALAVALAACRDRAVTPPPPPPPRVVETADAAIEASVVAVDEGPDDTKAYLDFDERAIDVQNAYKLTYDKMTDAPLATLDDAVVICRIGIVEPAPLPSSKWDRANGRDLMLEIASDEATPSRVEGPLGEKTFHLRADASFRQKHVKWTLHDRDQDHAYPYVHGIVVGTLDLPGDAKIPFHADKPIAVDCRGAASADASRVLLPEADRALDEAEKAAEWNAKDPRSAFALRDDLSKACDKIRVGSVIAKSTKHMDEWKTRRERARTIVRGYLAKANEAHEKLAPAPHGVWTPVGPALMVRTTEYVCPPVPKNADPGSLNDDQREGCGLAVELKSLTKIRFDPNAWGPAYACRQTGQLGFESLDGPAKTNGVCVLGFRRGKQWLKNEVVLSPEPTTAVLAGKSFGKALRISLGDASAVIAPPPSDP